MAPPELVDLSGLFIGDEQVINNNQTTSEEFKSAKKTRTQVRKKITRLYHKACSGQSIYLTTEEWDELYQLLDECDEILNDEDESYYTKLRRIKDAMVSNNTSSPQEQGRATIREDSGIIDPLTHVSLNPTTEPSASVNPNNVLLNSTTIGSQAVQAFQPNQ